MGWSPRQAFGRLAQLLLDLLRQGLTPHKLALTVALGFFLGLCPVVGTTTLLCTLAALACGLNLPLIQIVNYLAYPLEILMIVPFLEVGARLFGTSLPPVEPRRLVSDFRDHFFHALGVWGSAIAHALVAWLIVGGTMAVFVYLLGLPLIQRLLRKRGGLASEGETGGTR
jgi:uncharacterized protein (DUF2062 family)